MRRFIIPRSCAWTALCCAILLLSACPYSSEHPIGDPGSSVVDASLLGAWEAMDEENGERFAITFSSAEDRRLVIRAEGAEEKPHEYAAFVAELDGERFLSIRENTGNQEEWYYANYRVDGDRLMLRLVDDMLLKTEHFDSPRALAEFIRMNIRDPRLYAQDEGREWDWVWSRIEG